MPLQKSDKICQHMLNLNTHFPKSMQQTLPTAWEIAEIELSVAYATYFYKIII